MALHAIVGLQTGDEGKGVWVDRAINDPSLLGMTRQAYAVVKSNGGDNAGHTIKLAKTDALGDSLVCKLFDSGVKYPEIQHIFGSEVVCNLMSLKWELGEIRARLGYDPLETTHFSERMSLILPYHRIQDFASEAFRAKRFGEATGTTGRGIRPAYADLANRDGIRASALRDKDEFAKAVTYHCENSIAIVRHVWGLSHREFKDLFSAVSGKDERRVAPLKTVGLDVDHDFSRFVDGRKFAFDIDQIIDEYWGMGQEIVKHIENVSYLASCALRDGKEIIGEVSQGFLLDVVEGLPPNTTSSHTTSHVVATSLGVNPMYLKTVLGVCKAYETKVGTHAFPEEFTPDNYPELYESLKVFEFGAVTGRQRMVGALSMPTLRRAIMVNGVTDLVINKIDLMSGKGFIPMTWEYVGSTSRLGDTTGIHSFTPSTNEEFLRIIPMIRLYSGFREDVSNCRERDALPGNLTHFFSEIESDLRKYARDLHLLAIGVGPGREDYVTW